jgi:phosphopantothenoylcysteine decarboxylase/phosphopantothenate--cysteine ligase
MAEPMEILGAIGNLLLPDNTPKPLSGKRAIVTSGPTHEPIDPVRYLSNHSSGKQGYAIARALRAMGAQVTLVSGPVSLPAPAGLTVVEVETARQMHSACEAALPADIFISVAAVADWHVKGAGETKLKKDKDGLPNLALAENPDILAALSRHEKRPKLVIGFAAETHDVLKNAKAKLARKKCDWIIANDVSGDVMGGDHNAMILVRKDREENWPRQSKDQAARQLAGEVAAHFGGA